MNTYSNFSREETIDAILDFMYDDELDEYEYKCKDGKTIRCEYEDDTLTIFNEDGEDITETISTDDIKDLAWQLDIDQ